MGVNKTVPTTVDPEQHIAALVNSEQRGDCQTLVAVLRELTGQPPVMWGPTIVGFGAYHYQYASGREGDACLVGIAARGRDIVIYLSASGPQQGDLLERLGKHRMTRSCLYVRRLADIDIDVLRALVCDSINEIKRRYPI
jgi:Domain of unknown function (DU1801)